MKTNTPFVFGGIGFVVLIAVSVIGIGGGTPDPGASAQELARFYDENAIRQGISSFVLAAAAPLVLLFGIGLATTSATRREGGLSGWGYLLLSGAVLVAGSLLLTAFVHIALANGGDDKISPPALEALNSLDGNTWMAFNPSFGVMLLGAAGVLLSGTASRGLAWVALVLGLAAFVPYAGFVALLGTLVWIVIASVTLGRGQPRPAARTLDDAPASAG